MEAHKRNSRALLGLILIVVGLVMIAGNMHWIPFEIRNWIFRWQIIVLTIGIILLVSKENKGPGLVMIMVGGFFLAVDMVDNAYLLHRLFWPSMIILLGLVFILRGNKRPFSSHNVISDEDSIDDMAIFGGGNQLITSKNFKGGKMTAVFGGSTIDFSQAQLANGINVIDAVMIFGGMKLIIPRDWDIQLEVTAIFGGFTDKRIGDPHIVQDPSKKLVIKGIAVFGGGELNYL